MAGEGERLSRAGNYVLGLMSEADRLRAERDLEIDPAFRDAVLKVAERMKVLDFAPQKDAPADEAWKLIAERIAAMPQMRGAGEAASAATIKWPAGKVETVGRGLHAIPSRRATAFTIALVAAFVAGYVVALWRM